MPTDRTEPPDTLRDVLADAYNAYSWPSLPKDVTRPHDLADFIIAALAARNVVLARGDDHAARLPWNVWNEVPHPDGMTIYDPDGFRGGRPTVVSWAEFERARSECTMASRVELAARGDAQTEALLAALDAENIQSAGDFARFVEFVQGEASLGARGDAPTPEPLRDMERLDREDPATTLHPGQHEFRTVCRLCGEDGMLHVAVITHHERVTISDPRSDQ